MPIKELPKPFRESDLCQFERRQKPAWFAVFTHPRHEKKIESALLQRGVEAYLPTYSAKKMWKNRQTVTSRFPLFPNYLFAQINPQQRASVLSVAGVLRIVGDSSGSTIDDHYIDVLRTGLNLRLIEPYNDSAIGDRVRIVTGPMAGVQGILAQVRSEYRVVVSIALIRQSISIEVSRDAIEPVRMSHEIEAHPYEG